MQHKVRKTFGGAQIVLLTVVIVACLSLEGAASESNSTIIKTFKDQPIVIETQVPQYEEPNLTEYQQCHSSRERCLQVCQPYDDVSACEAQCPTCPILVSHDVLVQGVNDTDYREPAGKPVNTTNVIKITNEIRNIIDNTKNITARNENNVHIYQTNSTTGGKFGLGYNEQGPCCNVVRKSANCHGAKRLHCRRKRQRVCGARCKAKEMLAKRVTYCDNEPTAEDGAENCHEGFEYIPITSSRQHGQTSRCRYVRSWPYVSCGQRQPHVSSAYSCRHCMQLPYGHILRSGMPAHCRPCFDRSLQPARSIHTVPMWYDVPQPYPGSYNPGYDSGFVDWDTDFAENGWKVDQVKCRLPDGTLTEDCNTDETVGNEQEDYVPDGQDDFLQNLPEAQDETLFDDDYSMYPDDTYEGADHLAGVEAVRRRRHAFHRSAYSHRDD